MVYNTDQYLQGLQLLDAAETRNTNAEIDKIVDFKNETLNEGYEIIGTISTAYCGTLMMGTLTYSLGGGNVSFLSATADTGEDLLTDCIAGNIDEALEGGSPLRSMLISNVLSGAISVSTNRIAGDGGKRTFDAIDGTDVRKAVKDIDAIDVGNVVNNIDASDIKNAVKDIDAPDVTSGKYSLLGEMPDADGKAYERFLKEGPQEGLTQAEIIGIYKADKQATLNATNRYAVSGKGIKGGTKTIKFNEVKTFMAEETNQRFIDNVKPDYKPSYKHGTLVKEIELTENTTFVRVYDNIPDGSGMYGSWVMKAEDIEGLTPLEIQNKFALPNTPKYVCDVELDYVHKSRHKK